MSILSNTTIFFSEGQKIEVIDGFNHCIPVGTVTTIERIDTTVNLYLICNSVGIDQFLEVSQIIPFPLETEK